jgi:hypothetical protein
MAGAVHLVELTTVPTVTKAIANVEERDKY